MSNDVKALLQDKDIVIITETQFNIRSKCPEDFFLVGRSTFNPDTCKPRGGVAVYKKCASPLQMKVLSSNFTDCVILEICSSNVILVALYIPPSNSLYFEDCYFENLGLILNHFLESHSVYLLGDLNSRVGDLDGLNGNKYIQNPDVFINRNGRELKKILNAYPDLMVVNGLLYKYRKFDSKYT